VKSKILFLSILLIVIPLLAFAGKKKLPPIHFVADRVVAAEGVTFISGHVKVFMDNYILTARTITLFTSKNKEIYKIKAAGNVRLMGRNRFAVCDTAIFYRRSGRAVLRGDPKIWEGADELKGKEIVIFLNSRRIIVRGATGRFSPTTLKEFGK